MTRSHGLFPLSSTHLLTEKMPAEITTTRDEALAFFKDMSLMRRMELVADMCVPALALLVTLLP
jgi:hypothetical protein